MKPCLYDNRCGTRGVMINEIHQKEKDEYQRIVFMWDIKEQRKGTEKNPKKFVSCDPRTEIRQSAKEEA